MSHSYTSTLIHFVFSTKHRRHMIHTEFRQRLWAYIGGIARENGMVALAVNGADDHCHALLSLPATMPVAKAAQLIKGGSSLWVHRSFPGHQSMEWQEGYGSFSIGVSQVQATMTYIANQEEHHRHKTFEDEFLEILRRHGIEYDPRYVWG